MDATTLAALLAGVMWGGIHGVPWIRNNIAWRNPSDPAREPPGWLWFLGSFFGTTVTGPLLSAFGAPLPYYVIGIFVGFAVPLVATLVFWVGHFARTGREPEVVPERDAKRRRGDERRRRTSAILSVLALVTSAGTVAMVGPSLRSVFSGLVTPAVLIVDARPVRIDFGTRNRGQTPGCGCGDGQVLFPNGPYSAKAGEWFRVQYDASTICRGQGFENFSGQILWDGKQSTPMANNYKNDEFPGIAGSFEVRYSKPGDYNVNASLTLDCVDRGAANCRNTCRANGTTTIHIE